MMKSFEYKDAKRILQEKNHLNEIQKSILNIELASKTSNGHKRIQKNLKDFRWETEARIFPVKSYPIDAFKDGTGIEIERSLIDAVHRTLFRSIWAHRNGTLNVLVFILPLNKEPKFHLVKRDIQAFKDILEYPIYLIGIK